MKTLYKGSKTDYTPSLKGSKETIPLIVKGINHRIKNLKNAKKVFMQEPVKFSRMILSEDSRIDELESLRDWILKGDK